MSTDDKDLVRFPSQPPPDTSRAENEPRGGIDDEQQRRQRSATVVELAVTPGADSALPNLVRRAKLIETINLQRAARANVVMRGAKQGAAAGAIFALGKALWAYSSMSARKRR